jgi:hypothetical protein
VHKKERPFIEGLFLLLKIQFNVSFAFTDTHARSSAGNVGASSSNVSTCKHNITIGTRGCQVNFDAGVKVN